MHIAAGRLLALGAIITASLLGATHAWAEIVSCPTCNSDPSTVLISNPGTGTAATRYATDADYQVLLEALERDESAPDLHPVRPGPGSVSITWLTRSPGASGISIDAAHDVTISHIDFVRLESDGRLWVQTDVAPKLGGDGVSWGDDEWHAVADPAAVHDVLERAGVLAADSATKAKAADDAALDETAPAESDSRDRSAGVFTGWWWLLPGAAAGMALGLGARPLGAELARRREPRPRHQLIG